jgi:hypothetical protein
MKDSQHTSKDNDKFLNMMEVSFGQYDVVKCKTRMIKFALLNNLLTTPFAFKVLISIVLSTDFFFKKFTLLEMMEFDFKKLEIKFPR